MVFQITQAIWQGPFASPQRLSALRQAGISHILNVGESPSVLHREDGPFAEVCDLPIVDLQLIPLPLAIECLDALHRMACTSDSRVYVHCVAGWNRSPTILWLYLVACGAAPEVAKELVAAGNIDAVPGHGRLVDEALVKAVVRHASTAYHPHPRPFALEA